jgi:hypothetical protein
MPVTITGLPPKAPVPLAQSPEYKKLQEYIEETKQALDDISTQLVRIEMKYHATANQSAQTSTVPMAGQYPSGTGQTVTTTPNPPPQTPPTQGSFEESIAEMRRIAGLR